MVVSMVATLEPGGCGQTRCCFSSVFGADPSGEGSLHMAPGLHEIERRAAGVAKWWKPLRASIRSLPLCNGHKTDELPSSSGNQHSLIHSLLK